MCFSTNEQYFLIRLFYFRFAKLSMPFKDFHSKLKLVTISIVFWLTHCDLMITKLTQKRKKIDWSFFQKTKTKSRFRNKSIHSQASANKVIYFLSIHSLIIELISICVFLLWLNLSILAGIDDVKPFLCFKCRSRNIMMIHITLYWY